MLDHTDPTLVNHVMAEHNELFRRLTDLRTRFTASAAPTPAVIAATVADLAELRRHLATHFAREEEGGLLEESVARLPRLAAAAGGVLRQHPGLLGRLDALVARLAAGKAGTWTEGAADFAAFAAALHDHERAENAVFQEGHVEDLDLDD
ncbi:MAG: hemerythrin domain-containing protein [Planctomycetota bacterium]